MSGGVIIAESNKIATIECFRYFLKKDGVTKPILVKKNTNMGSSKITPLARVTDATVEMYEVRLI